MLVSLAKKKERLWEDESVLPPLKLHTVSPLALTFFPISELLDPGTRVYQESHWLPDRRMIERLLNFFTFAKVHLHCLYHLLSRDPDLSRAGLAFSVTIQPIRNYWLDMGSLWPSVLSLSRCERRGLSINSWTALASSSPMGVGQWFRLRFCFFVHLGRCRYLEDLETERSKGNGKCLELILTLSNICKAEGNRKSPQKGENGQLHYRRWFGWRLRLSWRKTQRDRQAGDGESLEREKDGCSRLRRKWDHFQTPDSISSINLAFGTVTLAVEIGRQVNWPVLSEVTNRDDQKRVRWSISLGIPENEDNLLRN